MDTQQLLEQLRAELAEIERQQEDKTASHSDQRMLDLAWDDISNKIFALEESPEAYRAYIVEKWGLWCEPAQFLEEAPEDARPPTPIPPEPVKLQTWVREDGAVMTGIPPSVALPPPPPKATYRVCNCDSDGVCAYCEYETRKPEDCAQCSGCHYCRDGPGYDGADEI